MEQTSIVDTLISNLIGDDLEVFLPTLRIVGNILTGKIEHCDTFIKYGLLNAMTIGWNKFGSLNSNSSID
jgi:hypothetical protein